MQVLEAGSHQILWWRNNRLATTIAAGNTAIVGGDQGAETCDLAVAAGYPSISLDNHATTTNNGASDSAASTTPT